jgi:putative transposase
MHLPHLLSFHRTPVVFLTTCTNGRQCLLAHPAAHLALHDVWEQSAIRNGWYVGQYVLMPDHVHLFACPAPGAVPMSRWMQIWKMITAKRINRSWERVGAVWQADYFDRYMRSPRDYAQKWEYVAANPVRKGLVPQAEAWPYRGIIHDLRHHASRD